MTTSVDGRFGRYAVLEQINDGGLGIIYRTADPAFVYKEYKKRDSVPELRNLERLVGVGRKVLITERLPVGKTPESSINWPVDIMFYPDGGIKGVLLPAFPSVLFRKENGKPRLLEYLMLRRGDPPSAVARFVLLLRMAEILAYLHSLSLVHGDINYKNLVWSIDPDPLMYLIDCDGMVPSDPRPTEGVIAAYWTDPRVLDGLVPAHDQQSDWYALSLAMYRGLLLVPGVLSKRADGTWSTPSEIPSALAPGVAALLRQALGSPLDPDVRPAPRAWVSRLRAAYVPGGDYDRAALARLDEYTTATAPAPPIAVFTPVPPLSLVAPPVSPPLPVTPPVPIVTPPPLPPPTVTPPVVRRPVTPIVPAPPIRQRRRGRGAFGVLVVLALAVAIVFAVARSSGGGQANAGAPIVTSAGETERPPTTTSGSVRLTAATKTAAQRTAAAKKRKAHAAALKRAKALRAEKARKAANVARARKARAERAAREKTAREKAARVKAARETAAREKAARSTASTTPASTTATHHSSTGSGTATSQSGLTGTASSSDGGADSGGLSGSAQNSDGGSGLSGSAAG